MPRLACLVISIQIGETKAENDEFVRQCAEKVAVRVERLVRGLQQARRKQVGTSETDGQYMFAGFSYDRAFCWRNYV